MSKDEKLQRADKAVRDVGRIADMIRRMGEGTVPLAEGFLAQANASLARLEPLRDKLAERKSHPTGEWHHHQIDLMCRMSRALKRGAELSLEAAHANVALLGNEDAALGAVRVVGREPAFLQQRCALETALGEYLWYQHANGIDTVLRAFGDGEEPTIAPQSPEEAATRARRADELKAAAAADPALHKAASALATELEEARVFLQWARGNAAHVASLEGKLLEAAVADPDWAKFFAQVAFLAGLGERVRGHAALAKLFSEAGTPIAP